MRPWTFKAYRKTENDISELQKWLDGLDEQVSRKIKTRFRYLETERVWEKRYAKKLHGHDKIWEIRIKYSKEEYRPLGCHGPGEGEFTVLIGAMEISDKLNPKNAIEEAEKRRILILNDRRLIDDI